MLLKLLGQLGAFRVKSDERSLITHHPEDKYCLITGPGKIINLKDSSEIQGTVIDANQTVKILAPLELTPHLYHGFVGFNPALAEMGCSVTTPGFIRPSGVDQVWLIIRTHRKLDLSELNHVFQLYQIS